MIFFPSWETVCYLEFNFFEIYLKNKKFKFSHSLFKVNFVFKLFKFLSGIIVYEHHFKNDDMHQTNRFEKKFLEQLNLKVSDDQTKLHFKYDESYEALPLLQATNFHIHHHIISTKAWVIEKKQFQFNASRNFFFWASKRRLDSKSDCLLWLFLAVKLLFSFKIKKFFSDQKWSTTGLIKWEP